ncbi:hypothetical protein Glove_50g50 [Diversispora epigaea]|uniref:Uncharacterized protein n=1 Tax=Diversispora epigaea TaxID=1348612 RepID=A0A397JPR8_9GLOM|nr:hypothetical protein Glove_50g50 [Diversispora epigaea]
MTLKILQNVGGANPSLAPLKINSKFTVDLPYNESIGWSLQKHIIQRGDLQLEESKILDYVTQWIIKLYHETLIIGLIKISASQKYLTTMFCQIRYFQISSENIMEKYIRINKFWIRKY